MKKHSVLIVDDNMEWCEALKGEIAKYPAFEVVAPVHNGKDAIDVIARIKPDIVLLDLVLPEFDGLYIINYIRSQMQNYYPFIYILSVIGTDRTNQIIQNLDVNYYSIKPIQTKAVASNLSKLAIEDRKTSGVSRAPGSGQLLAGEFPSINLSNQIDNYLFEIGAPLNRLSTKCSHTALEICLSDESKLSSIKNIYKMVGDMSSPPTTPGSIERNIRSTVQNIQKAGKPYFKECFPEGQTRLTNTQFIDLSVYIIKRRIEEFLSGQASGRKTGGLHNE